MNCPKCGADAPAYFEHTDRYSGDVHTKYRCHCGRVVMAIAPKRLPQAEPPTRSPLAAAFREVVAQATANMSNELASMSFATGPPVIARNQADASDRFVIGDTVTIQSAPAPTGGSAVFSESGAIKHRNSDGSVTTLAAATPKSERDCQTCRYDCHPSINSGCNAPGGVDGCRGDNDSWAPRDGAQRGTPPEPESDDSLRARVSRLWTKAWATDPTPSNPIMTATGGDLDEIAHRWDTARKGTCPF